LGMILSRKALVRWGVLLLIALNVGYFVYSSYFAYVWHDEALVLLHLSGHTVEELTGYLFDGQIKSTEDLRYFQGVNGDRGFGQAIDAVYSSTNYDLPFYYALLWVLARLFGNSDLVFRGFSVMVWFGFVGVMYALSGQLSKDRNTAFFTGLLVFLSPRFTGYALGIWEYGLYAFLCALSSFWYLKAIASPQVLRYWVFSSLSAIAGLYTHVFYLLVVFVQISYLWINWKEFPAVVKKFAGISWLVSFLVYSLWLTRIFWGNVSVFAWSKGRWSWDRMVNRWIDAIASFFPDIPFPELSSVTQYLAVFGIFGVFVYLGMRSDRRISSFVILLTTIPFISLLLVDIFLDYRYTVVGRFYLPSLLGIALGMGFFLAEEWRNFRGITLIFLILLTIFGLLAKIPNPPPGVRFAGYGSNRPPAKVLRLGSIVD
jgi:uncharacterized membrane protein